MSTIEKTKVENDIPVNNGGKPEKPHKQHRLKRVVSRVVFSRGLFFMLFLAMQVILIIWGLLHIAGKFPMIMYGLNLVAAIVLILIINEDEPAEFKLTWSFIVLFSPIVGVMIYLFNKTNWGMFTLKRKVNEESLCSRGLIKTSDGTMEALSKQEKSFRLFADYMYRQCDFPTYHNTKVTYYEIGEKALEALVEELKTAEKFIFIEYFIVSKGEIWDEVLDVLKEKVKEGVEVKIMYDGLCSLTRLPYRYPAELKKYGIEAKMFAPVIPFLSTTQNNRDHRKIVVIDGRCGFTGGVNIADEYANITERFGHWKDVGIKLEGRAVMSLTRMFIQNWNLYGKIEVDYEKYLDESYHLEHFDHNGFVIPYGDEPTDRQYVGKTVYEDMINNAVDYIYVMTPYFIVDGEFLNSLRYAAQRGVDVRIILPHIPDKKGVYAIARSFYPLLLSAGIKVYEYKPGFVHAKVVVVDDREATVGTVNMDYRSFYHHFENGVYMYETSAIEDIKADFMNTVEKCLEVDITYYRSINVFSRALGRCLRLFAPLM